MEGWYSLERMISPAEWAFLSLQELAAKYLSPVFKCHVVNSRITFGIYIGPHEKLPFLGLLSC